MEEIVASLSGVGKPFLSSLLKDVRIERLQRTALSALCSEHTEGIQNHPHYITQGNFNYNTSEMTIIDGVHVREGDFLPLALHDTAHQAPPQQ